MDESQGLVGKPGLLTAAAALAICHSWGLWAAFSSMLSGSPVIDMQLLPCHCSYMLHQSLFAATDSSLLQLLQKALSRCCCALTTHATAT